MANKKTRALTTEELTKIVETLRQGFTTADNVHVRSQPRVAAVIITQANTGLRIGDVLNLRLSDFIYKNGRYHFNDFIEQKTKKVRSYSITTELYTFLQAYALEHGIKPKERLFPITVRTVQHYMKLVSDYLGYENIGTHSARKYLATEIYTQTKDLEIVRSVMMHSSIAITQRYLSYEPERVEEALQQVVVIPT